MPSLATLDIVPNRWSDPEPAGDDVSQARQIGCSRAVACTDPTPLNDKVSREAYAQVEVGCVLDDGVLPRTRERNSWKSRCLVDGQANELARDAIG